MTEHVCVVCVCVWGGGVEVGGRNSHTLTNTMHKQLGLGREVVVDDVVQLRNVDATCCQVCDNHDLDLSLLELGHVDLASCLVQGAVDIGAADSTLGQQLSKQPPQSVMSTFFQTLDVKTPQLNQKQVSVSHFSLFNCRQKNSMSFYVASKRGLP